MVLNEEHAAAAGHSLTGSEIFNGLFGHISPHELLPYVTNHLVLMLIAGFAVLAFMYYGHTTQNLAGGAAPKGRVPNLIETLVLFVRDQMVYDIMGKENGRKFAPLFLTQFFFIWVVNLLGLLPIPFIGGTATASLSVTAALATVTLACMVGYGMKVSGPIKMWTILVPHGVPGWMWPLMFVVEVLGFFIKPFALTIRLLANMMGGHMVFLALYGMIYLFNSWIIFGFVMPMVVFVGLIELLVAFLQAFIFTFLSVLFIQASIHPEH